MQPQLKNTKFDTCGLDASRSHEEKCKPVWENKNRRRVQINCNQPFCVRLRLDICTVNFKRVKDPPPPQKKKKNKQKNTKKNIENKQTNNTTSKQTLWSTCLRLFTESASLQPGRGAVNVANSGFKMICAGIFPRTVVSPDLRSTALGCSCFNYLGGGGGDRGDSNLTCCAMIISFLNLM